MCEDFYDSLSLIFSHWWPTAEGEVTAVSFVPVLNRLNRRGNDMRLVVAYKFSIGADGPYTGESMCRAAWSADVSNPNGGLGIGSKIMVRYRRDDPSVNKLDSQALDGL